MDLEGIAFILSCSILCPYFGEYGFSLSIFFQKGEGSAIDMGRTSSLLENPPISMRWTPQTSSCPHVNGRPLFCPVSTIEGLPCSPAWLPLRVTPATPEACLSVLVVIVRTDIAAFP